MAKYVYPAIFEPNEMGGLCVSFPDVQGAYTEGKDLTDAMEMAQDVLCLTLYNCEIRGIDVLPPTPIQTLQQKTRKARNGFVTLIACDTDYYKRFFMNIPLDIEKAEVQ